MYLVLFSTPLPHSVFSAQHPFLVPHSTLFQVRRTHYDFATTSSHLSLLSPHKIILIFSTPIVLSVFQLLHMPYLAIFETAL